MRVSHAPSVESLNPLPNKRRGVTTDDAGFINHILMADSISIEERRELNQFNRVGELEIGMEKLLSMTWRQEYFELVNGILYQYVDQARNNPPDINFQPPPFPRHIHNLQNFARQLLAHKQTIHFLPFAASSP
jgi:hypothetical protein